MGTDPRNTLGTGPKYDYYLRKDVDVYILNLFISFNLIKLIKIEDRNHQMLELV